MKVLLSIMPASDGPAQSGLDYVARWRHGDGSETEERVNTEDARLLKESLVEAMRQSDDN